MQSLFSARSAVSVVTLLVLLFSVAVAQVQVPVSGYEIYLGHGCVINGSAATCGATFTGWTGETTGGRWLRFPGTGKGVWSIRVNYTGQPKFNGSVTIVGGKWTFLFISGTELLGKVISGTVTWPPSADTSIGCGNGVAVGRANLTVAGGGAATVAGCLHDLPAGSVIPPKIWGTFNF